MPRCNIIGCGSRRKKSLIHVTLHRLPTIESKRKAWMEIIGSENIDTARKHVFVCSLHFEDSCFNRTMNIIKLRDDALPSRTLLLPSYIDNLAPERTKPGPIITSFDTTSDRKRDVSKKALRKNYLGKCKEKKLIAPEKTSSEIPAITAIKVEPHEPGLQQCSQCKETISGFVFACVQCGARECGACDARGQHAQHYVLRAPAGSAESELDLVLRKVREALPQAPPPRPPSADAESGDTEFEVIKMEIKVEEEEYQRPTADPLSIPDDQTLPWDANAVAEGSRDVEAMSTTSSATLTASNPSDLSCSDSEEMESLAPCNLNNAERRRSRVYARLQQAFTSVHPHIKVTGSHLEERRKIISSSDDEILKINDEIGHVNFPKGSIRRFPLKVTSSHEISETQDLPSEWCSRVDVGSPGAKPPHVSKGQSQRGMTKHPATPLKPPEVKPALMKSLPTARSGRVRRMPVRLLT